MVVKDPIGGSLHDQEVERRYKRAANRLPDGYWDEVHKEQVYFEDTVDPRETLPPKGNTVGEFDLLHVNYEDKVMMYEEVKTSESDLDHAQEQLERAKDHFEDTEWTVITSSVLAERKQ